METDFEKKKLRLEIRKLELELIKLRWEETCGAKEQSYLPAADRQRLEFDKQKFNWEKDNSRKAYFFRTYMVPFSSIVITLIVAFIGYMSYLQQSEAKDSDIKLKEKEINLKRIELDITKEKNQQDFNDKKRLEQANAGKDFDTFLEKYKTELSTGDMRSRIAVSDKILQRFSTTAPNLIIDYFRTFRDMERPSDTPSTDEKACQKNWENCKPNVGKYYQRAAIMNHIRYPTNSKITVYIFGSKQNQLDNAETILKGEGFSLVKESIRNISVLNAFGILPSATKIPLAEGEVRFFYEQDETFADTIGRRLNECLRNQNSLIKFRKVYFPETDYRNSRKIEILVDSIQLKSRTECDKN